MSDDLKPWGPEEKEAWFARQTIQRSYDADIVARLRALPADLFRVEQYGALSCDPARYPLYRVISASWDDSKPNILITGGVHGYEPSGAIAALRFLEEIAASYAGKANIVVYPCVSPLGYEINHRWTRMAEDPNRHFGPNGTAEEALNVMSSVTALHVHFNMAVDLHETNQRDVELFHELCARDGKIMKPGGDYIPEGFYLYVTGEEDRELGREIIDAVRRVTPITTDPHIFGDLCEDGLVTTNAVTSACQNFAKTVSDHAMTTEIYPENMPATEAQDGQLAVVRTAIDYALRHPAP